MAADGAATLGNAVALTVLQRTSEKLDIVQGKIVVGVYGYIGLCQRVRAEIEESYSELKDLRPEMAVGVLRGRLWDNVVGREMAIAAQAYQLIGQQAAQSSAVTAFLVARPLEGRLHLVQFDQQCSPELATQQLPFMAIGSGQNHADPFLSFIRKTLWPKGCPSLQDGVFSAVWTLRHAIENSPGGLAYPIQVVVLEKTGKNQFEASDISLDLQEHERAVEDAGRALREWREQFTGKATTTSKQPPSQQTSQTPLLSRG